MNCDLIVATVRASCQSICSSIQTGNRLRKLKAEKRDMDDFVKFLKKQGE